MKNEYPKILIVVCLLLLIGCKEKSVKDNVTYVGLRNDSLTLNCNLTWKQLDSLDYSYDEGCHCFVKSMELSIDSSRKANISSGIYVHKKKLYRQTVTFLLFSATGRYEWDSTGIQLCDSIAERILFTNSVSFKEVRLSYNFGWGNKNIREDSPQDLKEFRATK